MSQFIEMFGDFHNKVQIKDVCLVVSGKSIPTKLEDNDGNNPYIKVADFNIPGNEKYITIAQRYVSDDSASYSKQIPEGSVIFAKNGAASMSNKKRLTKIRCCIDMNTMAVFPKNESILSDFLFATIEAMDVSSHVRQGAIPSISPKSIEDSYIAMPTMEEQYRYVSIAKHADKSGFDGLKSQFIEMFGTIDEPKVEVKKLIDVVLSSGQYGSNTSATDYQEGKPRYIRITDINDDGSLNDDIKTAEVIEDKYRLIPGDIVFARTGATVGKTYMHETGNAIYAGYLIKYQMNESKMKPAFMKAFTHSKTYYNWVANSQKVGAQPNISAAQYDNMPVLVPQIEKQEEFLAIYHQADKSGYVGLKSGLNFAKLLIHR